MGSDEEPGSEEGDHHDEHKRKRRKKKTILISSSSEEAPAPMPGLKIRGKIDLEALKPKKKDPLKPTVGGGAPGARRGGDKRGKTRTPEVPRKVGFDDGEDKKKKGRERSSIDAKEVKEAVRRTMTGLDESRTLAGRAKMRKQKRRDRAEIEERRVQEQQDQDSTVIRPTEFVTASELANFMRVDVGEVISKCISLGLMVSINQRLDKDTIHSCR